MTGRSSRMGTTLMPLLIELQLSPEQEAKIRQRAIDAFQKAGGKLGERQKAAAFVELYQELDTEQRQRLIAIVNRKKAEEKAERTEKMR